MFRQWILTAAVLVTLGAGSSVTDGAIVTEDLTDGTVDSPLLSLSIAPGPDGVFLAPGTLDITFSLPPGRTVTDVAVTFTDFVNPFPGPDNDFSAEAFSSGTLIDSFIDSEPPVITETKTLSAGGPLAAPIDLVTISGGETRIQSLEVTTVPEANSFALLGILAAGAGFCWRRQTKRRKIQLA